METTIRKRFVISIPEGLHLRPASLLTRAVEHFDCVITICRDGCEADAKSPLSMVLLEADFGKAVMVVARGYDAVPAMVAITDLFDSGFCCGTGR